MSSLKACHAKYTGAGSGVDIGQDKKERDVVSSSWWEVGRGGKRWEERMAENVETGENDQLSEELEEGFQHCVEGSLQISIKRCRKLLKLFLIYPTPRIALSVVW